MRQATWLRPSRRSLISLALAGALLGSTAAGTQPPPPAPMAITVSARAIPRFDQSPAAGTRFGALDYVGGFAYSSRNPWLQSISAIRLLGAGRFLAVTDTGYWFAGRIERDGEGRPTGIADAALGPILDPDGQPPQRKGDADAEGLAIGGNGEAVVAFERDHRIAAYANAAAPFAARPRALPLPIPRKELRTNAGLEMIAVSPSNGPLRGRTVVVSEKSLDADGNLFAGILGGGIFKVRRAPPWSVTDGAFLPDGDLLLLERRYEGLTRVGMRIRRIDGHTIRPGALVDGPVLMEADLSQEIDNMEGMDVYRAGDGSTRIVLVSDDNGSFFQRNLFLEFKLEDAAPSN